MAETSGKSVAQIEVVWVDYEPWQRGPKIGALWYRDIISPEGSRLIQIDYQGHGAVVSLIPCNNHAFVLSQITI